MTWTIILFSLYSDISKNAGSMHNFLRPASTSQPAATAVASSTASVSHLEQTDMNVFVVNSRGAVGIESCLRPLQL